MADYGLIVTGGIGKEANPVQWIFDMFFPPKAAKESIEIKGCQEKGVIINCPCSLEIVNDSYPLQRKIETAVKKAKGLGCKIVGVPSFFSRGEAFSLAYKTGVALTDGTAFEIIFGWQGIKNILARSPAKKLNVLAIGPMGYRGELCLQYLASKVDFLSLFGDKGTKLRTLQEELQREWGLAPKILTKLKKDEDSYDLIIIFGQNIDALDLVSDKNPLVWDLREKRGKERGYLRHPVVEIPHFVSFPGDYELFAKGTGPVCAQIVYAAMTGRYRQLEVKRRNGGEELLDVEENAMECGFTFSFFAEGSTAVAASSHSQ
jgi:hypothetical protein